MLPAARRGSSIFKCLEMIPFLNQIESLGVPMPRIPQGPIDLLVTYTAVPPNAGDTRDQDYYVTEDGKYTIWGVGLITFGAPTADQLSWMANLANTDLTTFPTD